MDPTATARVDLVFTEPADLGRIARAAVEMGADARWRTGKDGTRQLHLVFRSDSAAELLASIGKRFFTVRFADL